MYYSAGRLKWCYGTKIELTRTWLFKPTAWGLTDAPNGVPLHGPVSKYSINLTPDKNSTKNANDAPLWYWLVKLYYELTAGWWLPPLFRRSCISHSVAAYFWCLIHSVSVKICFNFPGSQLFFPNAKGNNQKEPSLCFIKQWRNHQNSCSFHAFEGITIQTYV